MLHFSSRRPLLYVILAEGGRICEYKWLRIFAQDQTSLNPVPNAQVCVFDGTYYKVTTTNYIFKTSLCTTFRMYSSGPW